MLCKNWRTEALHQRQEAMQRLAAGETQADVARTYNVDATTIGRLLGDRDAFAARACPPRASYRELSFVVRGFAIIQTVHAQYVAKRWRHDEAAMIRKLKSGGYRLYSRKINPKTGRRRNLGTFKTRAAAEKHERAVQYFKRH
jgi:hypothetical protein